MPVAFTVQHPNSWNPIWYLSEGITFGHDQMSLRGLMATVPAHVQTIITGEVDPSSRSSRPRLGYRPALDGLRAIAVLVVMAYHAYIPFFGGGRIGVDIFFVLNGFLITSLLLEEWHVNSRIHLRNFYYRRLLRLLPALLLLLVVAELFAL